MEELEVLHDKRQIVLNKLRQSPFGLDPLLEVLIPKGIAVNSGGLSVEEREIIEEGFRMGSLLCFIHPVKIQTYSVLHNITRLQAELEEKV